MRVLINPTKPFYLNEIKKSIRCGNFPETGKVIDYEDEMFISFFKEMSKFIDIKDLENIAKTKYSMNSKDFNELLKYLMNEKFVITDDEYDKIYNYDKLYNRQNAYFFMVSEDIKNIDLYKNKNILILGLGGIGSNVAEQLVRAGFSNFTLVDCDIVESSNLIRQNAYYSDDIGISKSEALSKRLKLINNNIKVNEYNTKIFSKSDALQYIEKADFVICTLDKPYRKIRRIINSACVKCNKPVIFSGFAEHVGMVGPFVVPHITACLECIDKPDVEIPFQNVKIVPSFGPLCNIISCIVAAEVINYFVKYNSYNLIGCTLMFNIINYKTEIIKWNKNPSCKECGDKNDSK